MLDGLTLNNFQSHESTGLDFAPGVTAIVGTSDSGKTALLRALRWIVTNRPRGGSFVRHGSAGRCLATLTVEGHQVTRQRIKSSNKYKLDDEEFEALGSDVPPVISDLLGLQSINMQGQFDGHFLIFDPPGKIASTINDAIHLGNAEAARDAISADLRENGKEIARLEEQEKGLRATLARFAKLTQYETKIQDAKEVEDFIRTTQRDRDGVASLKENLWAVEMIIAGAVIPDKIEGKIETIEKQLSSAQELEESIDDLQELMGEIEAADRGLPDPKIVGDIDRVVEELAETQRKYNHIHSSIDNLLDELVQPLVETTQSISTMDDMIIALQTEHEELLAKLDVCPTCERALDPDSLEAVLRNAK